MRYFMGISFLFRRYGFLVLIRNRFLRDYRGTELALAQLEEFLDGAITFLQNELVRISSDLMKNILDVFDEAGVEILSPQYALLRLGKNVEGQTPSRVSRSISSGS
jgi:hypothetical protein